MSKYRAVLEPGEATIARARIRARQRARRIANTPIDRGLYAEVQQFLDDVGFRACDALEELSERADPDLRHRLHLVLGIAGTEDCP